MARVTLKNVFKIYKGDKGKDVTAVHDFRGFACNYIPYWLNSIKRSVH